MVAERHVVAAGPFLRLYRVGRREQIVWLFRICISWAIILELDNGSVARFALHEHPAAEVNGLGDQIRPLREEDDLHVILLACVERFLNRGGVVGHAIALRPELGLDVPKTGICRESPLTSRRGRGGHHENSKP